MKYTTLCFIDIPVEAVEKKTSAGLMWIKRVDSTRWSAPRAEVKTTPNISGMYSIDQGRKPMYQFGTTAQKFAALAMGIGLTFAVTASAVDAEAAKAFARQNNCFKCHGTDKDKDGPSLKSIAAKYKGNADAESKLTTHLTSGEMAKFPDGHSEAHKKVEPNDPAQVKNLVDWILSL